MSSKTTQNAPLIAFLLWNALAHLTTRLSEGFNVVAMRWRATRERYEVAILYGQFKSQIAMDVGGLAVNIFEVVIVIFIIGALIGNIANVTTGITIAHTGFTPNPNLTASPGAVPLTQLYPLIFVALGLLAAFAYFKKVESA